MDHHALDVESRLHIRRPIRGQASLVMKDGSSVFVHLFDIGEGGLCVTSQWNLRTGLNCLISASVLLSPSSPTRLHHPVEVVYSVYSYSVDGFKIGFRFKKIDQALTDDIQTYVCAFQSHKARFLAV